LFAVPSTSTAPLIIRAADAAAADLLMADSNIIAAMTKCDVQITASAERPRHSAASVVEGNELFVQLEGLISFEKESARLQKEISNIASYAASLKRKLENVAFTANAPQDVVDREKDKLSEAERNLEKLRNNLDVLAG
ncbi:MAG: valine--tRNA ligase, partial [Chlorobium limicola]|nr:valine--tRNA ligase [Chlorobium limicola]